MDLVKIAQVHPMDFFAGNVYAAANYVDAPGRANPLVYPGIPRTGMGWPVTDDVLYYFVKFAYQKYGLPVLVSENGYAGLDSVMLDGKVHDPQRRRESLRGVWEGRK